MLHAPSPGVCDDGLSADQAFPGARRFDTAVAGTTTVLSKSDLTIGDVGSSRTSSERDRIYIWGATGNWAGLNGTWTVLATRGGTITIPFNSTRIAGRLTGTVVLRDWRFWSRDRRHSGKPNRNYD